MNSVDVKSIAYIDSSKENNNKDPKFKIGDIVRISKYKNIFAKGYTVWSKNVFVIKRVENIVAWIYIVNDDLNGEEIVRNFYKNE